MVHITRKTIIFLKVKGKKVTKHRKQTKMDFKKKMNKNGWICKIEFIDKLATHTHYLLPCLSHFCFFNWLTKLIFTSSYIRKPICSSVR